MPEIKITRVKGFSCQDEKYPAKNILTGGKWLSSSSRHDTSMSATFQLAECCTISSVHIGNSGSAFISLWVSRTDCSDMKDFLPCSALMTIQESKTGQNKNCVKIYNKGDFLEETRDEKWDQLRVMVTQPFNLQMQFGLCFVHVFSFPEGASKDMKTPIDLSKWEKMKNESSPRNSLSNKSLTRGKRLFLESGQQHVKLPGEEKAVNREENEIFDELVFETSALSFLESLKLTDKDLDNIQLVDVRKKMEKAEGREFSSRERQILINIVKTFVKSLKSSDTSPYFNRSSKATNSNRTKSSEHDAASASGWLTTKKGDTSNSDTEQSPSVRRNFISLEDSSENKKTGQVLGDSSSNKSEERKHVTDSGSVYLHKKKMLKRRRSPVEDGPLKKFLAVECDKTNKNLDEVKTESHKSANEKLIECPICRVYFEAESIEVHSADCNTFIQNDDDEMPSTIPDVPCPVCSKLMSAAAVDIHAVKCAAEMFGD